MGRRLAQEYEERGYTVTVENQNEFRTSLAGATISGRMNLVDTRDQELVIIDAKTAKPSEAHVIQLMLYMLFLQLQGTHAQGMTIRGQVYYAEDHTVTVAAGATGKEFKKLVEGLIGLVLQPQMVAWVSDAPEIATYGYGQCLRSQ